MARQLTRRVFLRSAGLVGGALTLAACQPKIVEVTKIVTQEKVVKETVKETVIVAGTPQTVEKVVEKVVTPTVPPRKLLVDSGDCVIWDVPNSVADMPMKEAKEKQFKAAYPKLNVKIEYFLGGSTDDFKMKAVTRMAAGEFPDAIYFQNSQDWVLKGLILPLDDWVAADKDLNFKWEDYQTIAKQACTYRGKIYQLPMSVNAWLWYYNKKMFGDYGIKTPNDYVKEKRWTWEDGFLEASKNLTRGTGKTQTWATNWAGNTSRYWGHDDIANVLWSNGGDFFKPKTWRCTLDEPEAIMSFQYILDAITKWKVSPAQGAEMPVGFQLEWSGLMYTGIWMLSSGAWRESYQKFGQEKLSMVRNPTGKTGKGSNEGGAGGTMVTPVSAKHPETAWLWHKWNATVYIKETIATFHQQAPAKKEYLTDPAYLKSFAPFEIKEEWDIALEEGRALGQPLNGSEAINLIMSEWDKVKLGEQTVPDFAKKVKPKIDDLIKGTPED